MAFWVIYEVASGGIRTVKESPVDQRRLYENHSGGTLSAIITPDLVEETWRWRVENRRLVPVGMQQRRAKEREMAWFEFRRERNTRLARTDHLVNGDYPLSASDRRSLKAKRQASRDIPQRTTNPALAMQMLETIWSDADGME